MNTSTSHKSTSDDDEELLMMDEIEEDDSIYRSKVNCKKKLKFKNSIENGIFSND